MNYNFDEWIDRTGTSASKWDTIESRYAGKGVIPMWVADMDFKSPQPVIDALVKRAEHGIFGYTVRSASLLDSVVGWLSRRHGWKIDKKWISHSPGVVAALSVLVRAFTDPGDSIIIQPPVYHPFYSVIEKQGRNLVVNPLQFDGLHYHMDFDHLQSILTKDTKMLILCNPHNPVGRVWTEEELRRLGDICLKHNVLIVSDEIHHDLVFKEYTHIPIGSISKEFADQTITCIAPSKTFNLAGLHTSFLIIPNSDLKKRFDIELANSFIGGADVFGVVAAEVAYQQGDDWLDQVIEYIRGNLDYLTAYLEKHIPEIKVIPPQGTYLVWLDCRELGMDPKALNRFMVEKARLALNDGTMFGPGGEGFQRINIACPRAILRKALQQLEDAVHTYKRTEQK
jgi:cystathionine beta-lyase